MVATPVTELYRTILANVERLDAAHIILPSHAAKKPFAKYRKPSEPDFTRIEDGSDHANVPFDYCCHTYLELVFGVSGRAELAMAGRRYALAEGEMAFIPPGVAHLERILSKRQSYHIVWLNVKPGQLYIHSSLYSRADHFQVVRGAAFQDSAPISRCFESAAEEAQSGGTYWPQFVRARLTEGWVRVLRAIETNGTGLNTAQVQRSTIDKAKAFMQSHFAEDLTLAQIAGKVFLSPAYFSTLFSQHEKKTVFEYLHQLRMAEARRLLSVSALPAKQIARRVGVPSLSYFCRLFRRTSGCSAQEYRRKVVTENLKIGQ